LVFLEPLFESGGAAGEETPAVGLRGTLRLADAGTQFGFE
jgi:hypothetical protein